MNRRSQDERLADWVDGRMDAERRGRFEAELRVDPQLRAAADEYRRTVDVLRDALSGGARPARGLADRVLARAQARTGTEAVRRLRVLPWLGSAAAAAALVAAFLWVRELASLEDRPDAELTASGLVSSDDADGSADLSGGIAPRRAGRIGSGELRSTQPDEAWFGEVPDAPAAAADPSTLRLDATGQDAARGAVAGSKDGAVRKESVAPSGNASPIDGFLPRPGSTLTPTPQLEQSERAAFVGAVTVEPSTGIPEAGAIDVGRAAKSTVPPPPATPGPGQPVPTDSEFALGRTQAVRSLELGAAAAGAMVFVVEWPVAGTDQREGEPENSAEGGRSEARRRSPEAGVTRDSAGALSGGVFRALVDRIVMVPGPDREALDRSGPVVEIAEVDLSAALLALSQAEGSAVSERQRTADAGEPQAPGDAPASAAAAPSESSPGRYEPRAGDLAFRVTGDPAQRESYIQGFVERARASDVRVQLQRAPFRRVPAPVPGVARLDAADTRNEDKREAEPETTDAIDLLLVFRRPAGR